MVYRLTAGKQCRDHGNGRDLKGKAFSEEKVHSRNARESLGPLDTDHDIELLSRRSRLIETGVQIGRCWCHGVMSAESRSGQLFGTGKGLSGRQCPGLVNRRGWKGDGVGVNEKRERGAKSDTIKQSFRWSK